MPKLESYTPIGQRVKRFAQRVTGTGPKDISLPAEKGKSIASPTEGFRRAGEGLRELRKKFPASNRSMSKR